eukprot:GDKH01016245.1.p3 GENE.GDKH01016245.1~~GDKH01016245.1.p3  ORF type:complete len:54 (-),score=5.85 GDKH01016245.1:78-239(-)
MGLLLGIRKDGMGARHPAFPTQLLEVAAKTEWPLEADTLSILRKLLLVVCHAC